MTTETQDFIPYSVGLVAASVCTSLPLIEVADRLNAAHPTGIGSHWHYSSDKFFSDGKTANGSACPDHPETHKHYLFNC